MIKCLKKHRGNVFHGSLNTLFCIRCGRVRFMGIPDVFDDSIQIIMQNVSIEQIFADLCYFKGA